MKNKARFSRRGVGPNQSAAKIPSLLVDVTFGIWFPSLGMPRSCTLPAERQIYNMFPSIPIHFL